MTRWFRSYWAEEDRWFYFEVAADGWVARQVELQGPLQKPLVAASAAEWEAAREAGTVTEYESTFGVTAESPVGEWDGYEAQALDAGEFEAVWVTARAACRTRARVRSGHGAHRVSSAER